MLDVGRIAKAHGLRGEVVVELFTNRDERLAPGSVLETDGGQLVVLRSIPHQHRWIVAFEGIDTRENADALHGVTLRAEPIDDPDALWVHELVGSDVLLENDEKIGVVSAVLANPAGDIIETDTGILVPLRFVTAHGDGFVKVDPPEGLIDLYLS